MNFSAYTTKKITELFKEFETSNQGLSEEKAKNLLEKYGPNQLQAYEGGGWQIFLRQFRSPFVYLLLLAVILSFLLGQKIDGFIILLFVSINTMLGFYQESRSEHTLKLLKKYLVSKAKALRGGKIGSVDVSSLVPGDVILLEPGDMIPADIRFIDSYDLVADESVLTGESAPVVKIHQPLKRETTEIYKAQNIGFSGTIVTSGKGTGLVIATGDKTNYSDIARLALQTVRRSTFEKEISRFSKFTLGLVGMALLFVVLANVVIKPAPDFEELVIFSIALAVSVIPEALPTVMVFSLSLGALHLAKSNVIVRRLSAIEDLGSIEILCSDKTGTLTENRLALEEVYAGNKSEALLRALLVAWDSGNLKVRKSGAFESAMWERLTARERRDLETYIQIAELPFDPQRKRASAIVEKQGKRTLVVSGAPESVLEVCRKIPLSQRKKITDWFLQKGKAGFRVLAVGGRDLGTKDHTTIHNLERNLTFTGMISFVDPIKPTTPAAVEEAKALGVRVKILTGDSKEVAGNIAHQIKLISSPEEVIAGQEFGALDSGQKREAVEKYHVFARVTPQQKYEIVQLLQEKHEVGFLGEGINDAPALKIANVALAVQGASDIAREASDIILLKKSLKVIVDGIKEGRSIFANTNKYVVTTLAANFGNFFAVAAASLLIAYLPMLPLQILLLNLLSDFPMIAVATDTVDHDSIKVPRRYSLKSFAAITVLLGIVSSLFDFIFFGAFFRSTPAILQTAWFSGSVLTEILFIFSARTRLFFLKSTWPSGFLIGLSAVVFATVLAIPFTALGQELFHFVPLSSAALSTVLGIVFLYFASTEAAKLLYYRYINV